MVECTCVGDTQPSAVCILSCTLQYSTLSVSFVARPQLINRYFQSSNQIYDDINRLYDHFNNDVIINIDLVDQSEVVICTGQDLQSGVQQSVQ